MNNLAGFEIFIHNGPIGRKQFRFPTTKKRRIRNKWAKQSKNFKSVYIEGVLLDPKTRRVICSSATAVKLRQSITNL